MRFISFFCLLHLCWSEVVNCVRMIALLRRHKIIAIYRMITLTARREMRRQRNNNEIPKIQGVSVRKPFVWLSKTRLSLFDKLLLCKTVEIWLATPPQLHRFGRKQINFISIYLTSMAHVIIRLAICFHGRNDALPIAFGTLTLLLRRTHTVHCESVRKKCILLGARVWTHFVRVRVSMIHDMKLIAKDQPAIYK